MCVDIRVQAMLTQTFKYYIILKSSLLQFSFKSCAVNSHISLNTENAKHNLYVLATVTQV